MASKYGLTAAQKWAKNPHHTIPYATHQQNAAAKKALGTLDLTAPPTAGQALTEANSAADLQYGPQVHAAQQLQANLPSWFSNYQATVAGIAKAAQAQSAPIIGQAQAYQTGAAAQTTPGLDPNSAAGQQAAQAAQGRQALSQLGLDALNANAGATQDYFGGQQNMAARVLPQQLAAAAQAVANAQSQRGAAVQTGLTTARQNAQNYAIARGTLNLNSDKAAADTDLSRGVDPVTGKPLPAKAPSASDQKTQADLDYFNKHGYYPPTGPPATKKTPGLTPAQKQAAKVKEQTRIAGVRDKSGQVLAKIDDTRAAWDTIAARQILTGNVVMDPNTGKPKLDANGKPTLILDPKTGKPQTGKPTPTYVKNQLIAAGYDAGMIHVALLRRVNKPLDQEAIDYLHAKNVRIPRDWLAGGGKIVHTPTAGGPGDPKAGMANP